MNCKSSATFPLRGSQSDSDYKLCGIRHSVRSTTTITPRCHSACAETPTDASPAEPTEAPSTSPCTC